MDYRSGMLLQIAAIRAKEKVLHHPAIYALSAAVFFGAGMPFAKILLADIAPLPLAASLYLGSGLGTLPFFLVRGRAGMHAALQRRDLPWLLGAILAGGILAPVILLYGLGQTSAPTASLLLNLEVVTTSLFALLLFREDITRQVWGAIAVLVLGSVILSWNGGAFGFSRGALGIITATILWGLDNNLTCVIASKDSLSIAILKGFLGGGVLGILTLRYAIPLPTQELILSALLLGFLSYGLSTIMFILSLRNIGSARTISYFSIAPFIGAILSLAVFRQPPGMLFILALTLMLAGIYLLTRETLLHPQRL